MKKFAAILIAVGATLALKAEVRENSPRFFEVGFNASLNFSQNVFTLGELLDNSVLCDFDYMLAKLNVNDALKLDGGAYADAFAGINLNDKIRLKFFTKTDASGFVDFPYTFLKYFSEEKIFTSARNSAFAMDGKVFIEAGAEISLKAGKFLIRAAPVCFVPILYVPDFEAEYEFNDENSYKSLRGSAHINAYSAIPVFDLTASDTSLFLSQAFKNAGLDLSLSAEYPLTSYMDIEVALKSLPIKAAALKYQYSYSVDFYGKINTELNSSSQDLYSWSYGNDEVTRTDAEKYIRRSFCIGFAAAVRPTLFKALTITPHADFVFADPTYVNYGLKTRLRVFRIFSFGLHGQYKDKIWIQEFDCSIGLRAASLRFGISSQSADFINSFCGGGLGASLGVAIGV